METSAGRPAVADGPHRFRLGVRWSIAALLMGVTIINYLDRTCLSVAAPTLKKALSIDEIAFSHIVVAFQLTYLLMQPVAGRFIDRVNVRLGLAIAIAWWSVAQALTAFAGSWQTFALFRALLGVGEAATFPSAAKTVAQWFPPRERTLAVGILNVGAGVGALVAPPLVVFLILRVNWQAAFVVTGLLGLGWVVLWSFLYRSPDEHPWLTSEERALLPPSEPTRSPTAQPATRPVWRNVLTRRDFWGLAAARFLSEPAWQFFTYWIPLYLATERGMKLADIAYFAWVPFLAADVGCVFGGLLSPFFIRLGSPVMKARKLAATTCAVLMVPAIFIGTAPTAGWAVFFFSAGAFAHQAMSSTLLTLPADLFPRSDVATANGLSGLFGGSVGCSSRSSSASWPSPSATARCSSRSRSWI